MNWNQILENAIVGKLVMTLIDEGFRIELCDQDGGGLYLYAAPDGADKPEDGWQYFVRLTPLNGADVITDYSTNLEAIIKPVNVFAATFAE